MGVFKAVAIFGYYFAVRAKGADKTMTRQADTERTVQTNVPLQLIFDRSEQFKPRDAHLRDGWT